VAEPVSRKTSPELFRRLLPSFGPLDLSPIVAVISLVILMRVVDAIFNNV